ncbi:hypothetical protein B4O97_10420 [Marispirochaeta aestuarii]|uniref:2Fe-2S ferredoxin-type domain-containing protein n=1 Tax=Marispirochaeta aestuarii TaxID=1963862 RepID=A0A1Y1RZ69_9SPIO|nr:ASKHA domain-containing protein [Marispirochaeta aestuarii]ORC35136.1 hypothetical protein B4O97_10420 [Marispirochaeta aestuarii]
MKTVQLTMLREGIEEVRKVPRGTNLLEALQGFDDFDFDAPCGGKGTCGKCRVLVDGEVSAPEPQEKRFLSSLTLEKGERLACMITLQGDCVVSPLFNSSGAAIVSDHAVYEGTVDPPFQAVRIEYAPPSLDDQRSNTVRVSESLTRALEQDEQYRSVKLPLHLLNRLSGLVSDTGSSLTLSLLDGFPWAVLPRDAGPGYGVAVDIGTTTVVAYLVHLGSGKVGGIVSGLNLQKSWGGDVISRVQAVIDSGPGPQQRAIAGQLSRMLYRLVEEADILWEDLRGVSIAGNTVMMHLFAGIDPRTIAAAPFIPAFTEMRIESSALLLPRLPLTIPLILLPSISGFIGADIVAGMLATGIREQNKPAMLIDIGTNGEIVLGDRRRIVACSTAAGPAFEGATISCGLGGIPGAINRVFLSPAEEMKWTTIADDLPLGICGSGIIDLMALLVRTGLVDETGRLLPPDELPGDVPEDLRARVREEGFFIARRRDGHDLLFTAKDVREVQLAKAAVAAGIEVLLEEYGIGPEEISRVHLAGGFGSFIDIESAVATGLLPGALTERIVPAGNTAGAGALRVLLSARDFKHVQELAGQVDYVELSGSMSFQEKYVEQMFFSQH